MFACLITLLFIALSWFWLDSSHAYSRDQSLNVVVPVHVSIDFGGQLATVESSEQTNLVTGDSHSQGAAADLEEGWNGGKTEILQYKMKNDSEHLSLSSAPPPAAGSHGDHQPVDFKDPDGDSLSTFHPHDEPLNTSSPVTSVYTRPPVNVIIIDKPKRIPPLEESEFIEHRSSANVERSVAISALPRDATDRFQIREPCSLPQRFASKPLEVLLRQPWIQELKEFLGSLNATLVSMVTSDYKYRDVLLNWLISAKVKVHPPLSNILVLSLDSSLHQMLRSRGIASVHIPPEPLITVKLTSHVGFSQVHIIRLTVMRLINHWGYDVANYDTDAIILKNPEPLYHQDEGVDMIGSFGHFPQELYHMWGVAVCIGVVMIRATRQTGKYRKPFRYSPLLQCALETNVAGVCSICTEVCRLVV